VCVHTWMANALRIENKRLAGIGCVPRAGSILVVGLTEKGDMGEYPPPPVKRAKSAEVIEGMRDDGKTSRKKGVKERKESEVAAGLAR